MFRSGESTAISRQSKNYCPFQQTAILTNQHGYLNKNTAHTCLAGFRAVRHDAASAQVQCRPSVRRRTTGAKQDDGKHSPDERYYGSIVAFHRALMRQIWLMQP